MADVNKMKVRNVKFDFQDVNETHYINGNIFATHFTNALHVLFPEGEKFFIKSIKPFYGEIQSPELKEQARDFMAQEAIHHREHERFWDKLEEMGLKPRSFATAFKKSADVIERFVYFILPKKSAKKMALSMTTGMEHYTALFGNQGLGNSEFLEPLYPKEMFMLLQWHAAEELEHKAVAFDVYKEIGGTYAMRIWGMFFASTLFYTFAFTGMVYFIFQDKSKSLRALPQKFWDFIVNFSVKPEGAAGWRLLFDYFKPSFHPDDHDNYHLAEEFFAQHRDYFEPTEVNLKAS
jgi:predicted metal-dependent hydrolase